MRNKKDLDFETEIRKCVKKSNKRLAKNFMKMINAVSKDKNIENNFEIVLTTE